LRSFAAGLAEAFDSIQRACPLLSRFMATADNARVAMIRTIRRCFHPEKEGAIVLRLIGGKMQ
jgi:hypothetical protein